MAQSFPFLAEGLPPAQQALSIQHQNPQCDAPSVQVRKHVSRHRRHKKIDWKMGLHTLPEEEPLLMDVGLLSCLAEQRVKLGAMADSSEGIDLCKMWSALDLTVNQGLQLTQKLHQERERPEVLKSIMAERKQDVMDLCSAIRRESFEREAAIDSLKSRSDAPEQTMLCFRADQEKAVHDLPKCMDVMAKQHEVLETLNEWQLLEFKECAEQTICSNEQSMEEWLEESLEQCGALSGLLQTHLHSKASAQKYALKRSARVLDLKLDTAIEIGNLD